MKKASKRNGSSSAGVTATEEGLRSRFLKLEQRILSEGRSSSTVRDFCLNSLEYRPELKPLEIAKKYLDLLDEFPEFYAGETDPNPAVILGGGRGNMPYAFVDLAREHFSSKGRLLYKRLEYLAEIEERLRAGK